MADILRRIRHLQARMLVHPAGEFRRGYLAALRDVAALFVGE